MRGRTPGAGGGRHGRAGAAAQQHGRDHGDAERVDRHGEVPRCAVEIGTRSRIDRRRGEEIQLARAAEHGHAEDGEPGHEQDDVHDLADAEEV
jgi:hypothetical protein